MKENILKLLSDVLNTEDENIEKLDLTKDEDYDKFNKYVDECKKICDDDEDLVSGFTRLMFNSLFGFDMKDVIDEIKEAGDKIHAEAKKKAEPKVPELPSKSTPLDKQAHLHKIVGEYVDTYLRPYYKGDNDNIVDDAYAGLFEFACWVMNK